jgi:formylglycine-generating enzyme required for sulfatase activity
MAEIFISYRREDSKYQARLIYDALTKVLPRDHVFMDIDSIKPGDDFVEILEGWVKRCDILLALIGAGWTNATDPKTGKRRLDNPNDFVRIEVREALTRGIPVVPILLDGAVMPDADELPDDLKKLVRRHAQFVDFRTFDADVTSLINRLDLGKSPPQPRLEAPERGPLWAKAEKAAGYLSEGRLQILGAVAHGAPEGWFLPGAGKTEWFHDFEGGPEMVVVPAGSFMMGAPENEPERDSNEGPQHRITIPSPFAVGRFAVTRGQFAAFVLATGHKMEGGAYVWGKTVWKFDPERSWSDPGFAQDDRHPVVCVSWDDARAYIGWLNSKIAGHPYRLLSEAEWEYACRAGTDTPFWWGSSISPEQANYDGNYAYAGGSIGRYREKSMPVESFQSNPWGLYQVHGNVCEWCDDCWNESYQDKPDSLKQNGGAWASGDCGLHVLRGGSWDYPARGLRTADRDRDETTSRGNDRGFRVARTLIPVA